MEKAALSEIRRMERIFSTFRSESELSRWQVTLGVDIAVSPELAELLEAAAFWRIKTRGAFDPACEEWTRPIPRFSDQRVTGALDRPWEVARLREDEAPTARKLTPSAISLDAIAKGYIADHACSKAFRAGLGSDVMINLGGDVRHIGTRFLTVGVTDPSADAENARPLEQVSIRNQGLATSGGFRRGARIAGEWHSHLLDPRTGRPVDHISSASVIAPSAAIADVLATAFNVLRPEESLSIADSVPGVGCLLLRADGVRLANPAWERRVTHGSAESLITRRQMVASVFGAGFALGGDRLRLDRARSAARLKSSPSSDRARIPWDERLELAITFTFGDPRGGMTARRPYVVVYIDDADATPVRTVTLWAQDASWIRNLRRWFRGDRARQAEGGQSLLSTVTSPTRSPGRYTVIWDGRNDQGEFVEQGEYFVCIETIRQGSSPYFTREPFTFESASFSAQMEDYGAFRNIDLDFRERG